MQSRLFLDIQELILRHDATGQEAEEIAQQLEGQRQEAGVTRGELLQDIQSVLRSRTPSRPRRRIVVK